MSLWTRIGEALSVLATGEGLSVIFDRLMSGKAAPPEKSVAFTIAVIALGAKMAKADGVVTRDEISAFRQVFTIPAGEEANAGRVYDLARQDVAGFDAYARKIRRMFQGEGQTILDLLEGLFFISMADGRWHPQEDAFLAKVAGILQVDERSFRSMRARYVPDAVADPYDVLGVPANATLDEVRAAWKAAVRDSHPDRMIARGVPPEALRLAERRLIAINDAWADISARLHA